MGLVIKEHGTRVEPITATYRGMLLVYVWNVRIKVPVNAWLYYAVLIYTRIVNIIRLSIVFYLMVVFLSFLPSYHKL
jgi:hypothetical protein